MRKNLSDKNLFTIKMNSCDKSVFIATHIEDKQTLHIIGTRKILFQFDERIVVSFADEFDTSYPGKTGCQGVEQ